jgi:hypothetical protein
MGGTAPLSLNLTKFSNIPTKHLERVPSPPGGGNYRAGLSVVPLDNR